MRLFFTLIVLFATHCLFAQPMPATSMLLVNSLYDEQGPVISPDGRTLFFTIGNHPQNVGGKKDPGDIWISRRTGDQWSAPVHAGELLNNRG